MNFSNVKKLGVITVQKSNSEPIMGDYSLAGAEFTVTDADGAVVDTIKTDAAGAGQSKSLPLGTYTVKESKAPWGFVINREVYTRTLSGDLGAAEIIYCPEISVPERPQTGQVRITKLDAETADRAQGDATLAGAVFDLIDADGKLVERLYCGSSNSITSKEVKLGSYTVKEVSPPRGYTLTQKSYPIKIDYVGQEVSINLVSENVSNVVIKGKIQLVKHSDDPDPDVSPDNDQVQEPLKDIVFEVYLKSSGSYNKARPTERDLITTDEHGYARTTNLPYGTYTVKEVQGADEHKMADPFDVFISQNGKTYYYIVENPAYHGKVKVIKTDAETGKLIPQPGIEFKIKDTDTGEWVAQEILYPTPIIIDSYLTNADGWLVMPKPLRFGNYELHEVQAPYGYTLSETPIPFEVTSENPVEFLEVTLPNAPVKGTGTVRKTGEVLTGAAEILSGGRKVTVPEYTVRGIEGATFDIIAAEDIVTPDGTIRAEKGEIVDTITTG
ncbi:MAG: SrtB family sortase, partial [Clostridiales Family XIII bacterium]|nr:SrtB family sortase [Clostridiales Family XIII bacterium]